MKEKSGNWLSKYLTSQTMLALVAICILSLLLMYFRFAQYMVSYAGNTYGDEITAAENAASDVCDFLAQSHGDIGELDSYASGKNIYLTVEDESGKPIFSREPSDMSGLCAVGVATKSIDGIDYTVRVSSEPVARDIVISSARSGDFLGVTVLNVAMFAITALMIYIILLSPIKKLRKTMLDYSTYGTMPERCSRPDELGRAQNTFADVADSLKAKEADEHRLIASIAHDIRTPLTSVMGYSERLLAADLSEEKRLQYQRNVYDKAVAIKSVVDEFDDYIEMGTAEETPMTVLSIGELCSRLYGEFSDELNDMKVSFDIDCRCPNEKIRCNYDKLRRYFGNLIGNAIQHAKSDALALSLLCERREDMIVIEFSDNGCGVPPEIIERIFEPFFTTDKGRKVSGLGLSICRSIIHAHEGSVRAENRDSGGFAVIATIPCCKKK